MPVILMSVLRIFVIPGLTRNPYRKDWIPAFAGMTLFISIQSALILKKLRHIFLG